MALSVSQMAKYASTPSWGTERRCACIFHTNSVTAEEGVTGFETGYGETVLIADDESTVRLLMVDAPQDAGYRVLEAVNGPGGLKILQSETRIAGRYEWSTA